MGTLNRSLFASARTCPFGCQYCFAKFDFFAPDHPLPTFSDERVKEDHVIYPTCDGEFFADAAAVSELEALVYSTKTPILVSISVKSSINTKQARLLRALNDELTRVNGIIKCSVSLSLKYQTEIYEPRTPSYSHRFRALRTLAEERIPTTVNLKPILPFVSSTEYDEIIIETAPYVKAYLIGGLYIDSTSEFGRLIKSNYPDLISIRSVDWLPNRPQWEYCEDLRQLESVRWSINAAGHKPFDTDVDVMRFLRSESLVERGNRTVESSLSPPC